MSINDLISISLFMKLSSLLNFHSKNQSFSLQLINLLVNLSLTVKLFH